MKFPKGFDCTGIELLPWDERIGANCPIRKPANPLIYPGPFAAAVWKVPITKNTEGGFFWSAGPLEHGRASNIEDGMQKADESLRLQGFVVP